jgi:hypothetical protein
LPKLVFNGIKDRIMAAHGTIDLCFYVLPDGGTEGFEVVVLKRRNPAHGRAEVDPIYTPRLLAHRSGFSRTAPRHFVSRAQKSR